MAGLSGERGLSLKDGLGRLRQNIPATWISFKKNKTDDAVPLCEYRKLIREIGLTYSTILIIHQDGYILVIRWLSLVSFVLGLATRCIIHLCSLAR